MRVIIGLLLLIASPAFAQQSSPGEQALGNKLMQEIQSGLNCSTALITAQADLSKAQARIKELEPKTSELKQPEK